MNRRTAAPATIFTCVLSMAFAFDRASAQLIVGQEDENEFVYHLDLANFGALTPLFSPAGAGITVGGVEGLAVDDANRTIYWSTGSGTTSSAVYGVHYDDKRLDFTGLLRVRKVVDIRAPGGLQRVNGLAWDSTNAKLYATDPWHSTTGLGAEGIHEINLTTGNTTLVVDLSAVTSDYEFRGLAYNPADGLFYAANADATPHGQGLFSIDINNVLGGGVGAIAPVALVAASNLRGLAIGDDRAYLVIDDPGNIRVYNLTMGLFEPDILAPWIGATIDAGGGWGPGALTTPPTGSNLAVEMSASIDPGTDVELGVQITYTMNFTNFGPDSALNTTFTATLSGGASATIVNITSTSGNALETLPGVVTDTFVNFGFGQFEVITITVQTTAVGDLNQTALLTDAGNTDYYLGNNTEAMTHAVRVFPPVETVFYANLASVGGSSPVPGLPGVSFKPLSSGGSNAFYRPARSPNGRYVAFVGIVDSATTTDNVVMLGDNGTFTLIAQEGVTATTDGDHFGSMILDEEVSLNNAGQLAIANDTDASTSTDETIIRYDGVNFVVVARELDIVPAFAAQGYQYDSSLDSPNINGNGIVAFRLNDLLGAPTTEDECLLAANGANAVAQEGIDTPLGGFAPWENFDTDRFWTDALGNNWLAQGDLAGSTNDDVLVVNGIVILQEGGTIPGLTGTIPEPGPSNSVGIIFPRMMSNGDWFCRGTTTVSDEDWVIKGHGAAFNLLARHGDEVFPGAGEHWSDVEGWSRTFLIACGNNQGDYILCGRTDNPDARRNTVAVLNGTTEILREGDPIDLDGNGQFDDNVWVRFFEESDGVLTDGGDFYVHVSYTDGSGTSTSGNTIGKVLLRLPVTVSPIPNEADVSLIKTASTDTVTALGQQFTYTLMVCNAGIGDATNVILTDNLPVEVAFVSATPPLTETAPGVVSGNIGTLPAFGCASFDIVVTAIAENFVTNTAAVVADQPDPNTENNTAAASTNILNHADVSVSKVDDGGAPPGQNFTYTITVTNHGPAPATNVFVQDSLDPTVNFVSATNGAVQVVPGVVERTFANMAPGASEIIQITAVGTVVTGVTNTVSALANEFDPDPVNNFETIVTAISSDADLAVTLTDSGATPVGGAITYTLTVTNNGPNVATNVVVQDALDPTVNFVSATNGATLVAPGLVERIFPSISQLGSEVFQVVVATTATGNIANTATVSGNQGDPDPLNNVATVLTLVGNFRPIEVIFSEVPGHPTAVVPGARDLTGQPIVTEFKAIEDMNISPDGSTWVIKGRNHAGAALETMMLVGSGMSGTMLAQEGQPLAGGLPGEAYDFFDAVAGLNGNNDFAFGCRARGGPAANAEKVISVIGGVHAIAIQQGDPALGLFDLSPNPTGDETFGNSLNSIHLLDNQMVAFNAVTIDNIWSTRRPAVFYNNLAFAQSGVTPVGGGLWDSFDSDDFRTTPDGSVWIAQGDDEGVTTTDDILVVGVGGNNVGTVVIRDGSPIGASGVTATAVFHTKLIASGDWFSRGDDPLNNDWVVRNGVVVAKTGDSVVGGAEAWTDVLLGFAGNANGDWILSGKTTEPDEAINNVIAMNGTDVLVREGDPVDLDGNGLFDDDAFIGRGVSTSNAFNANDVWLTDDGMLYFIAPLRDAEGNDLGTFGTGGDAFMRVDLSGPACPTILGDIDGDLLLNGLDAAGFVTCILTPGPPTGPCSCADMDNDNDVDSDDVSIFVQVLLAP